LKKCRELFGADSHTSISQVSQGVLNTQPLLQSDGKKTPDIVTVCVPNCWLLLGPLAGDKDSCPSGGHGGLSHNTTGLGIGVVLGGSSGDVVSSGIGCTGSSGEWPGGAGGADRGDTPATDRGDNRSGTHSLSALPLLGGMGAPSALLPP